MIAREHIRHHHLDGSWCTYEMPREGRFSRYALDKIELGERAAVPLDLARWMGTHHHRGRIVATVRDPRFRWSS